MKQQEQGSALIAVLCLIFMAGVLTGAVLSMAKYSAFTVASHVALQKSMYINEGAANRIQFLIAADRSVYTTALLLDFDYAEYDTDRFLADGVVHTLDYYGTAVEFVITDARSGYDLGGSAYRATLRQLSQSDITDTALSDEMTALGAKIGDYIDEGDELATDGFEAGDYEALNMEPLPRNAAFQFREELWYIPGIADRFPPDKNGRLSKLRLVAPQGMDELSGSPSLFTADKFILMAYCNIEEENAETVLEALETRRKERTIFSDLVDPLVLESLRRGVSSDESGNYTVSVGAPAGGGRPSRRLTFTYPGFNSGGPLNNTVQYYEWMVH